MIEIIIGFACALAVVLVVPTYVDRQHDTTGSVWYQDRIRANVRIAPPTFVFPVVWTALYIFMVTAMALWASEQPSSEWPTTRFIATWVLFSANLMFNRLWTLIFFSFRDRSWSVPLAVFDAFMIMVTAVAVVVMFHISPVHNGWVYALWYPYIAWTLFAFILTFTIWDLSKGSVFEA